jgi:hypothetical protein
MALTHSTCNVSWNTFADMPNPTTQATLEQRVATALTDNKTTSAQLAQLISDTEAAITQADQAANALCLRSAARRRALAL